jgi:hypothetical protein
MRKISVNNKIYHYRIGKGNTLILSFNFPLKIVVSNAKLKGVSEEVWERGQWKKTSDGMITPSDIKRYIKAIK